MCRNHAAVDEYIWWANANLLKWTSLGLTEQIKGIIWICTYLGVHGSRGSSSK